MPDFPPVLPPKPEPPDPSECCGSGCVRCVHDVYDEQLAQWREQVEALERAGLAPATTGQYVAASGPEYPDP